jgi:hypothetical protein
MTELGKHDLVLGYPWLKQYNPDINWQKGILQQFRCGCPSRPDSKEPYKYLHDSAKANSYATNRKIRATEKGVPEESATQRSIN